MSDTVNFDSYRDILRDSDFFEYSGRVSRVVGLTVESDGPDVRIGDICRIISDNGGGFVLSEVVGFRDEKILLMPFGELSGIGSGSRVVSMNRPMRVPVGPGFVGRIIDALGNPMDDAGPISVERYYPIEAPPPRPMDRERISEILPLGIKAIDSLLTVGRGQRLGIFAGSGVGKSTLLGMIAREASADVNIITLVGERGREVKDFIERDLKAEGLAKSVLVIATSDQPALLRLKSAMVGTAMAEYFRDQGYNVLLLMDSVTRYAMAQREIGMAIGEPPVSRGYTPSVYTTLPRLLERSGTSDKGTITALYTVLVEGDDLNEPITDTVRGILDGHIVLSRALANSNHYPAIDVLASVSRLMPEIVERSHYDLAGSIKRNMSTYNDAQDLINIGAYQRGSNAQIDESIRLHPKIEEFLLQDITESVSFEQTMQMLQQLANK